MSTNKAGDFDGDLEARARDLDVEAIGWKWMEIGFWIATILATGGLIASVIEDAVPVWLRIVAGILTGYVSGRAMTARRRRHVAIEQSIRLRRFIATWRTQ